MHKRRGRRRRMGKAAVLLGLLAALALLTSWKVWTPPEERADMSASELGYLCNLATYSPGQADDIRKQHPALTPGEIESLRQMERDNPGFTAALLDRYPEYAREVNTP